MPRQALPGYFSNTLAVIMHLLVVSLILTAIALGVHLVAWRIRIPRRQTRALAWIFAMVPGVLTTATLFTPADFLTWLPNNVWERLHVGSFYVASALAYIVIYSAVEERSPSMTLLTYVSLSPKTGRSRTELESVLGIASPVEVRLEALMRDGLIEQHMGMCRLTAKGLRWHKTFESLRRILGFSKGG